MISSIENHNIISIKSVRGHKRIPKGFNEAQLISLKNVRNSFTKNLFSQVEKKARQRISLSHTIRTLKVTNMLSIKTYGKSSRLHKSWNLVT